MKSKYYRLPVKEFQGFRYQIPLFGPIPVDALNWCHNDSDNRRARFPRYKGTDVKLFVELKNKKDLIYFLLRWQ